MRESPSNLFGNVLEFTVSEISQKLKRTVEDTFGCVRVRGEISGYRGAHSSGHSYFALKDDRARLEAVIWRGTASKMKFLPEEGMEVVASGKLTTYSGSSKYQIVIDDLKPAGVGALMALLEERREKLAAEGLFAEERKQLLPFLPVTVGVVTSPTGSVIRDILHRIADRFPVHVLVWPVRVQGETCGAEITVAIEGFNNLPPGGPIPAPDVIIVARGGGSLEDLWGLNDEAVVRAAANSDIPLVSAVGHETDWTLIDYAADVRAPTPTAAAELTVPVKANLLATVGDLGARLQNTLRRGLDNRQSLLRAIARSLPSADNVLAMPRRRFDESAGRLLRGLGKVALMKRSALERTADRLSANSLKQAIGHSRRRLHELGMRNAASLRNLMRIRVYRFRYTAGRIRPQPFMKVIEESRLRLETTTAESLRAIGTILTTRQGRIGSAERMLQSLSYRKVLERGYAVIRDKTDKPLRQIGKTRSGDLLTIEMQDGSLDAIAASRDAKAARTGKSSASDKKESQSDLF